MSKRIAVIAALMLCAVVFVTYHPGLRIGFYLDDYIYVERAGRTDWSNALVQIFDPRLQVVWYRPLQAIQWFLEYQIFGGNANAYHVVNIAFHAINVLLLYALVWRVSQKWLIAFTSAFFYATFTVYISGVNWVGIVDPLATIFYLLSIWFWLTYLERENWQSYALAFGAFVLALLSKQISVTIPIVLFLIEFGIIGSHRRGGVSPPHRARYAGGLEGGMTPPLRTVRALKRYGPFVAAAIAFTLIQYVTGSTHTFAGVFGWQFGATMAYILWQYLVLLAFPWGDFPSIDYNPVEVGSTPTYIWLVLALLILVVVAVRSRHRVFPFLSAFVLLTLLPVLPFPFLEHRYTYLPIMASAILLGLLFDHALGSSLVRGRNGQRRNGIAPLPPRAFVWIAAASLGLLAFGNGLAVNASALSAAEWARQLRVPFRDIERAHPTFPDDTFLYFIDPITPTTGGLSGMFFVRYGRGVSVGDWSYYARLREHNAAYVYYFDDARRPVEIAVEKDVTTRASLQFPVEYDAPIRLEGYEIARATIKRGAALVLILYWRGVGNIDRDYTVFAHLLDANGRIVAQSDSPPRKGKAPTRAWEPTRLVVDAIILPIPADAPIGGGYKIALGLYHAPTQQRLAIIDARGQPFADAIVIELFSIVE